MHRTSLIVMDNLIKKYLKDEPLEVIDIGSAVCGDQDKLQTYRDLFTNPKWHYTGADIVEARNVDVVLKGQYEWQFEDNSFDLVVSGQTLEHVEFPWVWMCEVKRIMKVGGLCFIIAPCKMSIHRCPIDTFRYYPDGMIALARWSGLEAIKARRSSYRIDTYLVGRK